jgi:mRNA interferase MazF
VLVLSSRTYNRAVGLAVICPITTKIKGYPFEVVSQIDGTPGAVLADHVRSLDWVARRAKRIGAIDATATQRVAAIVASLVGASRS